MGRLIQVFTRRDHTLLTSNSSPHTSSPLSLSASSAPPREKIWRQTSTYNLSHSVSSASPREKGPIR